MKHLKRVIIALIISYLVHAFCLSKANPISNWTFDNRVSMLFVAFVFFIVISMWEERP